MRRIIIGLCDNQEMIIQELQQMILDIGKDWDISWEVRAFTTST